MKTKHFYVAVLDVGELLPFINIQEKDIGAAMDREEEQSRELDNFIIILEKYFSEPIWYMGMDIIAGKTYERFIFEKGGFFEIMVDPPVVLNAHFVHKKRAEQFKRAIKKTLKKTLPKNNVTAMFINSINVSAETNEKSSLTYQKWELLKSIRN